MAGYVPGGLQADLITPISEAISPTGYDDVLSIEDQGFGNIFGSPEDEAAQGKVKRMSQVLFSGDKDRMADFIFESFPEVEEIAEDENGYQYFMHPDFGRIYTERPGLDWEDLGAGLIKTGAFSAGITKNILTTMVSEGVIGAGLDLVGGGDRFTAWKQGVEDSLWGAGGHVAGKVGGRLWSQISDRQLNKAVRDFEQTFNVKVRDKQKFRDQMGTSPDLSTVTPEAAEVISRGDMPLGRGQITGTAEDIAAQQQAEAAGQLDPLMEAQEASMQRFDDGLVPREETSARIVGDIRSESADTLGEAEKRYGLVEERAREGRKGYLEPGDYSIQDSVRRAIPDTVIGHLDQYPTLRSTLNNLGKLQEKFDYIRKARELTGDVGGVDVRDVRQYIRDIDNKITEKNLGTEEGRHILALRGELNDWYNKTITEAAMFGDEEVIDALKEATGMYAEWARRFKGPEGQRDIQNIVNWAIDGSREPEEVARAIIGSTWAYKPNAVRLAKWMRDTMGTDSDSFRALGEHALNLLLTNKTGSGGLGPQALRSRLKSVIDKDGANRELFNVLLGSRQLDELGAAYRDINQLVPQGYKRTSARRSSGTAERQQMMNMLGERYGWKGRLLAKLYNFGVTRSDDRRMRGLTTPEQLGAPSSRVVGGATTAAGSNEQEN